MSIARKSHRHFERVFPQLQKWHIMIVRDGEQKICRRDRICHDSSSLQGIGRYHEKFGAAEVKRGMAKSTSRRAFAALIESVSRSITAKVFGLGEKAGSRQSRSCSDFSSRCAGWMGSEGACALTRDRSVASAAHALYHTFEIEQDRP